MKKILCFLLVLFMCMALCACGGGSKVPVDVVDVNEVRDAIAAEYDKYAETNSSTDISMSYTINEVKYIHKSDDVYVFLVDSTWNFDILYDLDLPMTPDVLQSLGSALVLDLIEDPTFGLVNQISINGKTIKIEYTNTKQNDSIRVVIDGYGPISGYDAAPAGNSGGVSGDVSASSTDGYGHDKFDAIVIAEKTVKAKLKSPSTAEFCKTSDYTVVCYGDTWMVKGWVDAQNSFGATLRNNFVVKFTFSSSDKYTVDSCTIN